MFSILTSGLLLSGTIALVGHFLGKKTGPFTTEKVEEIHEYDREEKTTGESIGLWLGIGASVVAILGFVLQMCSRK